MAVLIAEAATLMATLGEHALALAALVVAGANACLAVVRSVAVLQATLTGSVEEAIFVAVAVFVASVAMRSEAARLWVTVALALVAELVAEAVRGGMASTLARVAELCLADTRGVALLAALCANDIGAIVDLVVGLLLAVVAEGQLRQLALGGAVVALCPTVLTHQRKESTANAVIDTAVLLTLLVHQRIRMLSSLGRHFGLGYWVTLSVLVKGFVRRIRERKDQFTLF